MIADPDDDALSWGSGSDPSHVDGPAPVVAAASGATPVSASAAPPPSAPRTEVIVEPAVKPAIGSLQLVTYGVLAGVYLIYTLGWVVSIQRLNKVQVVSTDALNAVLFGFGEILAMASPALWFAATLTLTRGRKPIVRLLWILVGLVAVIPWPFVLGAWI